MDVRIWLTACVFLVLGGCLHPTLRTQSAEETERDKDLDVRIIGDVVEVTNLGLLQLSGVGLVTGLDGTGGMPPKGYFRDLLEKELLKQKIPNVKAVLESKNNALVLVSAIVPPGLRKGEPLDLEITLPRDSRASSLQGGYLQTCSLRNYAPNQNAMPTSGHILARGHGPLLVGLGDPSEAVELKRARIWEGGTFLTDQPFYLRMKQDGKSYQVANIVTQRLNHLFRDDARPQSGQIQQQLLLLDDVTQQLNHKFDDSDLAHAITNGIIILNVPYAYRLNPDRYLRVAQLVPLRELQEQRNRYRQRLARMLLDPQDTIKAALRLEALGNESVPVLKKGLDNPHPLVRFAAAESLAYLGVAGSVEELARLAEKHVPVRGPCLLALANLDENVTRAKLTELLELPDPRLRYGAFFALRLLSNVSLKTWEQALAQDDTRLLQKIDAVDLDPRLGGEMLNRSFWLHMVAPRSTPMIHVSLAKRAEIVLFGSDIRMVTPVRLRAGPEFTVTAEKFDDRCTVSRISAKVGNRQCPCSLQVGDVLRAMAEMGADYPDIVEFLRKADERHCLSCPLHIDAVPESISVDELEKGGRDPNFLRD